jgi:hypothetical protein
MNSRAFCELHVSFGSQAEIMAGKRTAEYTEKSDRIEKLPKLDVKSSEWSDLLKYTLFS